MNVYLFGKLIDVTGQKKEFEHQEYTEDVIRLIEKNGLS